MHRSTLLLVVTYLLINSVSESRSHKVPTVVCEGSVARLKCGPGQAIQVNSAVYGRRDRTTCIAGRPASQIQNVRCSGRAEKVEKRCNGKRRCSIRARNSEFGEPCGGTYKYLEVDYSCYAAHKVPTVVCEGSVARLKCGPGQAIQVNSAVYGRRDRTTCIAGRPASQIQNVRCSGRAEKVEKRCNGKRRCSIRARNSEFGEPCGGTYKYLEVDYSCYARVTG